MIRKGKEFMKEATIKKDKRVLFITVFLIGIISLGLVVSTAYAANIKYQINQTIKENGILSGEIEILKIKINEATNVQTLEDRAQTQLGMVYPKADEFVYIAKEEAPPSDFAMLIKSGAYQ